jgi:hypothetical protein
MKRETRRKQLRGRCGSQIEKRGLFHERLTSDDGDQTIACPQDVMDRAKGIRFVGLPRVVSYKAGHDPSGKKNNDPKRVWNGRGALVSYRNRRQCRNRCAAWLLQCHANAQALGMRCLLHIIFKDPTSGRALHYSTEVSSIISAEPRAPLSRYFHASVGCMSLMNFWAAMIASWNVKWLSRSCQVIVSGRDPILKTRSA